MAEHYALPLGERQLLIVRNLHEEGLELPVLQQPLVVVPDDQMLLPVQRPEDLIGLGGIVPADVPQDEHLILRAHRIVPVLRQGPVVLLYGLERPVVKGQRVLMPEMGVSDKEICQ